MSAKEWAAEVEGVELPSPRCCEEAEGSLSPLKLDQGSVNLWTGAMLRPK